MKNKYLNDRFFSRLEALAFNLRSDLAGYFGGKHLVNTYGQTVEFADYREYQLGDDIRRIDWNLYSRFEKHFLKLFTDERQMQVQIFLDCSASMGKENPKKGAYAVAAAAAMGFLAVHNMDKVTFNLMKGERSENPFGTIVGKNSFYRAIGSLNDLYFDGSTDIEKCVTSCPDTGTKNGLTLIISDFFTDSDWKKAVSYLSYKRRQVMLLQVLAPEEIDPAYTGRVNLIDSEADSVEDPRNMKIRINSSMQKAYQEALAGLKEDLRSFCMKWNADFISVSTAQPIERVLFAEFFKTGILS